MEDMYLRNNSFFFHNIEIKEIVLFILILSFSISAQPITLINEDFENVNFTPLNPVFGKLKSIGTIPSIVSNDPELFDNELNNCVKFSINYSPGKKGRSELTLGSAENRYLAIQQSPRDSSVMEYAFSVYFPESYVPDQNEILVQWRHYDWKTNPDGSKSFSKYRSPEVSIQSDYDSLSIRIMHWDELNIDSLNWGHPGGKKGGGRILPICAVERDRWIHFTVIIHWNWNRQDDGTPSQGFIYLWKDDDLILRDTGANCFKNPDNYMPQFRFGIYKAKWKNGIINEQTRKRTVFFDNIVISYRDTFKSAELQPDSQN